MAEQNRTLWDQTLIAEGVGLLNRGIGNGSVGEYQIKAAIAAVHDRAARAEDTDWPQILALYGLLEQITGNPVVSGGIWRLGPAHLSVETPRGCR